MSEFIDQDLTGSTFERVILNESRFDRVRFIDAQMTSIYFTGVQMSGAILNGFTLSNADMYDVTISADLRNVVINGVDVAPLIDAELNRRWPERVKMKPTDPAGYADAWSTLERLWDATIARAKAMPEADLRRRVKGEWSFIQTLRHLNFATAAWVGRQLLGNPSPYHPLDLPWEQAPDMEGIPHDRDAQPALEEVLAIRAERQAMVRDVIASLTDADLTRTVSMTEPGWPDETDMPAKDCLLTVLNEEWEHRLYAERDLDLIEAEAAESDV